MIRSVHLRNFQQHKDTKVRFSSTVTTIVGKTNIGKSAVLRALRWVITNQPRGDAFINHDAKSVVVTVKVDGHKVVRIKGKGNHYKLDEKTFTAFGTQPPDEITALFNMDDLNFQGQWKEPAFWFSHTPVEVARRLNAIVDLGVIDSTLSNLGNMTRKARAENNVIQARLVDAKKARKGLRWVGEADAALKVLLKAQEALKDEALRSETLARAARKAAKLSRRAGGLKTAAAEGEGLVELGSSLVEQRSALDKLEALTESARSLTVASLFPVPDLEGLDKLAEELTKDRTKLARLRDLYARYRETNLQLNIALLAMDSSQEKLDEMDRCPLCERAT